MDFKSALGKRVLFFDGAMGTMLQKNALRPGEAPIVFNLSNADVIQSIHKQYIEAGADIITANTFGAYDFKDAAEKAPIAGSATLEEIISAALHNAKAVASGDVLVAMDLGPTGKLLKPMGDLSFAACFKAFQRTAKLGAKYGANLFILETFSDMYETKAAVLAAKETGLPVVCTMTFDTTGHTLTGADPMAITALLEGLGVDAIGINCGFGPAVIKNVFQTMRGHASLPILLQPNAGLPIVKDGVAAYTLSPDEYAMDMLEMCKQGAWLLGGCCGTTPAHIARMASLCRDIKPDPHTSRLTVATSYAKAVLIGSDTKMAMLRPAADPQLANALAEGDMDYLVDEAMEHVAEGAQVIGVSAYADGIDEGQVLLQAIETLQEIIHQPLRLEASSMGLLEEAARVYNGKPVLSAPDCREETLEAVFSVAHKYGGVIIIPIATEAPDAMGAGFTERVICLAEAHGINRKDVIFEQQSE